MTTKHLPGPWMILGTPVSPIPPELFPVLIGVEDAEGGLPIMAVHNVNGDYGDARLIAAAPDLLEALREIMPFTATAAIGCHGEKCREPWCHSCNGEEEAEAAAQKGCDAYAKARAAIARATGDQP